MVTISVTEKGKDILNSAPSLLHDRFRAKLDNLEEWEQSMILAALQRLASMMDAESIHASPILVHEPLGTKRTAKRTG
jgi:hypothetical protein